MFVCFESPEGMEGMLAQPLVYEFLWLPRLFSFCKKVIENNQDGQNLSMTPKLTLIFELHD